MSLAFVVLNLRACTFNPFTMFFVATCRQVSALQQGPRRLQRLAVCARLRRYCDVLDESRAVIFDVRTCPDACAVSGYGISRPGGWPSGTWGTFRPSNAMRKGTEAAVLECCIFLVGAPSGRSASGLEAA